MRFVFATPHGSSWQDEPKPFVRYERFEEVVQRLLESGEFSPDGPEVLLAAFRALDPEGKGYIDGDRMRALLSSGEPPLTEKELDSFMKVAQESESHRIYYDEYARLFA